MSSIEALPPFVRITLVSAMFPMMLDSGRHDRSCSVHLTGMSATTKSHNAALGMVIGPKQVLG